MTISVSSNRKHWNVSLYKFRNYTSIQFQMTHNIKIADSIRNTKILNIKDALSSLSVTAE